MRLIHTWACMTCDAGGEGHDADKDAEKHTKTTKHPTRSWAVPDPGQEGTP